MKLASLKGGRDGRLVVVSDDLAYFAYAGHIATTLQDVIDNWDMLAPKLELLATDLAHGVIPRERFHERDAAAPLPRAYQRVGVSETFSGARDPIASGGCRAHAGLAIVTGDVAKGAAVSDALASVRLIGLCMNTSMDGAATRLASTFSPVFVSLDSFGSRWDGEKMGGTISVDLNGAPLTRRDLASDLAEIVATAAKACPLGAGTIIGTEASGGTDGPALESGDKIRVWMDDDKHHPIFGVIEQLVG
jgi:fumarylacetoacetate (FAA) hydrolase